MYKVESIFTYKGFKCVVTFNETGYRCGYVGIVPGHMLYKMKYDEYLDIPKSELDNEEVGKRGIIPVFISALDDDDRIRMDVYFNVHGGLTYSNDNNGTYPIESNLWWLGFDCGHYGDAQDLDLVEEYWGDDEHIQRRLEIEREYRYDLDFPVRSKEYVEEECRSLVDQIIELTARN